MKIECSKEQLAEALNKIDKITGKTPALPVLSCILFDATADKLLLRGTNLEVAIEIAIPVKLHSRGIVAIPARAITSYVNTLEKDKTVVLEVIAGNVHISSSSNKTLIKVQPHDDFPSIPPIEDSISFSLKPESLSEGIKAVSYSAGQSSMKPELSSVYLYTHDNHLIFVATDSFRLAEKKVKVKNTEEWSALIPVKNVPDIVRILEDIGTDIDVLVTKHQIIIRTPSLYFTSRVVEGSFPDYKQIIPKDSKTEVTVLRQDLTNAFKTATIFSDKFNKLNIKAVGSDKKFYIKTSNSDVGETVTALDAAITGEDIDINFNYKYISECLQSITAASVLFQLGSTGKLVIRGVGDSSYMYLVMPMNR